jgi:hypothetical protein
MLRLSSKSVQARVARAALVGALLTGPALLFSEAAYAKTPAPPPGTCSADTVANDNQQAAALDAEAKALDAAAKANKAEAAKDRKEAADAQKKGDGNLATERTLEADNLDQAAAEETAQAKQDMAASAQLKKEAKDCQKSLGKK